MTERKEAERIPFATVVGAGIGGLAAAVLLARSGTQVEVIEASDEAGGLIAPIHFDGLPCDRGSHRIHPSAHPLLQELTAQAQWRTRPRQGRLVLGGRLLPYPPDPVSFLSGLGVKDSARMAIGWLRRPEMLRHVSRWEAERTDESDDEGFEAFVLARVGRAAYERFYQPYATKVWGVDPQTLSRSVAKQRVSTSNPLPSILGLTRREYLYPEGGMASLIDVLLEKARHYGVEMRLGERYEPDTKETRPVFFSGHLGDLAPEAGLSHRGLYLIHLSVPREAVGEVDTWYSPEASFWFGRVSQPAEFTRSFTRADRTVLCLEIPEGSWGRDQDFIARIDVLIDQLREAGVLNRIVQPIEAKQTFLPRIYPMYLRNWTSQWNKAMNHVAALGNVYPFGRQGLFLHCNMDQSVQTASDAVEHVVTHANSRLWAEKCQGYLGFRVRD